MLKLLKKLFGRSEASTESPASQPVFLSSSDAAPAVAGVETAELSLAAILQRFPDVLKQNVAVLPDEEARVVLPLSSILKQLPSGSVKMSLASIYRQAPTGTFKVTKLEEKRMVEVPLNEIFKRVEPALLKRRDDQRYHELAEEDGLNIFGDQSNPYIISPTLPPEAESEVDSAPQAHGDSPALRMPEPMVAAPPIGVSTAHKNGTVPLRIPGIPAVSSASPKAAAARGSGSSVDNTPLVLPLSEISSTWPDQVQNEIASGNGAAVALPVADVGASLARGKVCFTWGQIRRWINPPVETSAVDDKVELQLPLRVVAPAFLQSQRGPTNQKKVNIDTSIPALFAPTDGVSADGECAELGIACTLENPVAAEAPAALAVPEIEIPRGTPELKLRMAPVEDQASSFPQPAPISFPPATERTELPLPPVRSAHSGYSTIGQLFGTPAKTEWTPTEIVQHAVTLPSIAGALVALQEGLVVAHDLPDDLRAEVVAAFLPQIYARVSQYLGEMKLQQADEMVFSTGGARLHLYRLGYVFFAVLSKPGVNLQDSEIQLILNELARQTEK